MKSLLIGALFSTLTTDRERWRTLEKHFEIFTHLTDKADDVDNGGEKSCLT